MSCVYKLGARRKKGGVGWASLVVPRTHIILGLNLERYMQCGK